MSFEVTFACDSMVFSTLSLIFLSSSLCYQHASSHAASSTFLGVRFKGISSFHHGVQSVAVARLLGLVSVLCTESFWYTGGRQ